MSLTENKKLVLEFIQDYIKDVGIAPTQREIKEHFNLKSYGSVSRYLKELKESGFLDVDWNKRRGIQIPQNYSQTLSEIPLYGEVAAGAPLLVNNNSNETITVPTQMVKGPFEYFALRIKGDSMIEDGILEGDIVVIKKQDRAISGQTVVSVIENEATLKKFFPRKGYVELVPANHKLKPIKIHGEFQIAGILVGLLRSY
jgi:repressor LexA